MPTDPRTPIAYLVSQYPAANHTFILREILELRKLGRDIRVASVRAPDRAYDLLSAEEQAEQRATFYVKARGIAGFLTANLRLLASHPIRYLGSMLYALRLAHSAQAAIYNLAYLGEAAVVVDWLRRWRIQRMHLHFTSTVGLLAERLTPLVCSATIHGPDEFRDPAGFYLAEKIRHFRLIIAISGYGLGQLRKCAAPDDSRKLNVVRLGIDPDLYLPRAFRENPECFEILFVGRLAPVKGLPVLIAAFARLLSEGRKLHLTLIGDGADRPALERDVAERGLDKQVQFTGRQTAEQVRKYYERADIFCLPSLAEGIPVVLMEAMAMEIPCVATHVGGVAELIRDQVDGLLVAPSNEEELAAALKRFLDNPELRRRIGTSGRQRVCESYDLRQNVRRLSALFDEGPAELPDKLQ